MNQISRSLFCIAALIFVSPSFGEDEAAKKGKRNGAKGKAASAQMMSKLEGVVFTPEQKTKLDELANELNSAMAALREEGFTPELAKQKADAVKKAREEGKKGRNVEAEVVAAMDITDDQKAMLKKASEAQTKFQRGIATTLTEEQISTLPEELKTQLNRAKANGKKAKAAA
jgi:DNA-binding MarR family transcriptional regulator